ncbi:flavin reductase family protein [Paenarthrobacter nicotinovorans]|uniref:Flavin reductase family protein n=1 Tax=Paenarthrobacter nicotinovorans TaxID=29320 RepID=A0ABV0GXF5_PAENI
MSIPTIPEASVEDPSLIYRRVLGHVPTSVAVVTAGTRSGPVGMTVGSFTSVSLEPPLVAFFVDKASTTWPRLYEASHFGVNILGQDQTALCKAFSRRSEDRFSDVDWTPSSRGVPLLNDAIVTLECTRYKIDLIGDHYQVVGRVKSLELRATNPPLIFLQGTFLNLPA